MLEKIDFNSYTIDLIKFAYIQVSTKIPTDLNLEDKFEHIVRAQFVCKITRTPGMITLSISLNTSSHFSGSCGASSGIR